jgi:hypothetical protein
VDRLRLGKVRLVNYKVYKARLAKPRAVKFKLELLLSTTTRLHRSSYSHLLSRPSRRMLSSTRPTCALPFQFDRLMESLSLRCRRWKVSRQFNLLQPRVNTTLAEAGKGLNSTELATPEAGKKPERRQESGKDKYGNDKPPQGAVIMTMKMIDDMVNAVQWGGQAAITKMMSEYVKGQTGKDLASVDNKEPEAAAAKIVV